MSVFADLYNDVVDLMDTEKASGTLTYINLVKRGMLEDEIVKGTTPTLTIWPAFSPSEVWVAIPNRRQDIFQVVIGIIQEPEDRDRPFGQTTSRKEGILLTAADVMNALDNARTTFVDGNAKVADQEVVANDPFPIGQGFWAMEIVIRFKWRAIAGQR